MSDVMRYVAAINSDVGSLWSRLDGAHISVLERVSPSEFGSMRDISCVFYI